MQVRSLGQEEPLEEGMATHSSIFLPGESPWTEESGGLQSMRSQKESDTTEAIWYINLTCLTVFLSFYIFSLL